MKLTLLILFISALNVYGRPGESDTFDAFAQKQDSLFMVAYHHRDTTQYKNLLKEFVKRYDELPGNVQKFDKGILAGAYYNFCCLYSILDTKPMALLYLKKAIDEGYFDYVHMMEDSDLSNIRNDAGFTALLHPLKHSYDYMYVLKNAAKYNNADNRPIPDFTYQSPDDSNLVALRKSFKLDSIAGTGNLESKIINLLNWIHYLIPHNGDLDNPQVKNAMSMIAFCKREHRGLNCRGLATVLNECYLAMGFKSRFITCLPKDSLKVDEDCHVIDMVYDTTLKKWLWMDPTYDAYVMDEKGELLSIPEVRQRIVEGKTLIVNPDANWNRKNSLDKNNYFYFYMAKNLYIMECPVHSEYNLETLEKDKTYTYIDLLPLEYYKQKPDKTVRKDAESNATWIVYMSNNADKFWAAPH